MQLTGDSLRLSPSDLSSFLGCRHRTGLDLSVATGLLEKPDWNNPLAQALRQRGEEHERAYVESLKAQSLSVVDLRDSSDGPDATLDALQRGVDVVVQVPLGTNEWLGYADILRRIETPSILGSWSYEIYDTKLARETRGGTILQLAVYSELLAELQKKTPECFHVVTPPAIVQSYRFSEYAAYYRLVRNRLLDTLPAGPDSICETNYPEPVEQCEVCRWWERCNHRRRRDDHLSFVAGLGRLHRNELEDQGAATLAAVAALPLPIQFTPARGSKDTYERFRALGTASFALLGWDEMGAYAISISSDGHRVTVRGPITYALPADIEEVIRESPDISVVELSGPGGRKGPARQLARIIREHKLSTLVDDTCNSACAEVFLSGKERILGRNGALGFHRSEPYRSDTVNAQNEEESRQYYSEVGVAANFIDRVLETAYEEMWMPSLNELLEAGVVTHIQDGATLRDTR